MASAADFSLAARLKSPYSVWKKLQKDGGKLDDLFDIVALRVVVTPQEGVSSEELCKYVLSVVHKLRPHYTNRVKVGRRRLQRWPWHGRPTDDLSLSSHRTISRRPSRTATRACTPRCRCAWPAARARSRCRSARPRCTVSPSSASPRTPSTRVSEGERTTPIFHTTRRSPSSLRSNAVLLQATRTWAS